jgi:hypothetical protein
LARDQPLRARLRENGLLTAREHSQKRFEDRMVAAHEELV